MRAKRTSQVRLFDVFAAHEIGRELAGLSAQLDAHLVLLDCVAEDLGSSAATGRCGLTAESALRCALLKQYRQLSYEELAFHLLDSASFGAFARLPVDWTPAEPPCGPISPRLPRPPGKPSMRNCWARPVRPAWNAPQWGVSTAP